MLYHQFIRPSVREQSFFSHGYGRRCRTQLPVHAVLEAKLQASLASSVCTLQCELWLCVSARVVCNDCNKYGYMSREFGIYTSSSD